MKYKVSNEILAGRAPSTTEEANPFRRFRRLAPFLIALVVAFVFNYPALRNRSYNAGYMFTGDILGFYWPSLFKIRNLIAHGHFTAIDFSHYNGSAAFFLAPNLFSVYPVFVVGSLLSAFFKVNANHIERLLTWTIALNFFLAIYFSIRLTMRFLDWDVWQASLAGVFFGCSIYFVVSLGEPTFLFCAAPIPWIAYAGLRFVQSPSKSAFLLASVPVVFSLLGGYLPLGIAATAFGLMTALLVFWIGSGSLQAFQFSSLLRLVAPAIGAIALTSPFLADSYRFLKDSPSDQTPNLFYSAHQLSDLPQAILRMFSYRYKVPGPITEMSAWVGVIGLMILVLFFFRKDIAEGLERAEVHAIAVCIGLYSLFVLITYGEFSPLSDAFFYFVPQLGNMHIYQRFLMMSHIFLALALAIMLNGLTRSHRPESGRTALILTGIGLFAAAFAVARYTENAKTAGLTGYIVFELLGLFLFLALYRTGNRSVIFLSALVLMNLPALSVMYDWSLETQDRGHIARRNPVDLDEQLQSRIVQFMRKYSKKDLVKYVDLSPMWNAGSLPPFPKSFPYWVENQISLSSYHGFNFYLSGRSDYESFMPIGADPATHYPILAPNWQWLESTGADFAIVDAAALGQGAIPDSLLAADPAARLPIPNNLVIVPLAQEFMEPAAVYFDNGVFRVHRPGAIAGSSARLIGSAANLALGKPTRQSSQMGNAGSALAVDGNHNGNFNLGSVFHTQSEKSPWFEVDLGQRETVNTIRIWNRTDCCADRLSDYWIFLSDAPFPQDATAATLAQNSRIWRKHVLLAANPNTVVTTDDAHGRYVRVQADAPTGDRILHFAELEVFGPPRETGAAQASAAPAVRATASGNFANQFSVSIQNEGPVTLEYLMFYNPKLRFYVNGEEAFPRRAPGTLVTFDLPPGKNRVEVRYRDVLLSLFWLFYAIYGAAVAVVVLVSIPWISRRRARS
ncbi:MAG: discoidin domain-containing protein [Acidobacteriia bacterium]|nr:discoidin domain-containing protein [Terriglobia bacterium]